jgi:tetratricopeptide (TPR) repeat protein
LLFIVHLIASISSVAEENFFNALQNSEHVLGKQHRVTQIIQKNLIVLYQTNEKFEEAIPLQKHIIELKQHEHGSLHTSVAAGINNLAVFYCFLEDYQAAEFYYDKAIDIYQKIYGCDHPLVLDTKANKDLANANSLQTI